MIYLYLFGTCFHFIYVFMIIGNNCTIMSGAGLNPLSRNIKTCIYVGKKATLKLGNDVGISSSTLCKGKRFDWEFCGYRGRLYYNGY